MENLEFMKKFRPEELCVKDFKYWIVCVRQKQVTLGDVVILLKREIENKENKTWSDMWLSYDKSKFTDDTNFEGLWKYIKNNELR